MFRPGRSFRRPAHMRLPRMACRQPGGRRRPTVTTKVAIVPKTGSVASSSGARSSQWQAHGAQAPTAMGADQGEQLRGGSGGRNSRSGHECGPTQNFEFAAQHSPSLLSFTQTRTAWNFKGGDALSFVGQGSQEAAPGRAGLRREGHPSDHGRGGRQEPSAGGSVPEPEPIQSPPHAGAHWQSWRKPLQQARKR